MTERVRPVELALVVPSARRHGGGDVWLDGLLRYLPRLGVPPLVVFEGAGELVGMAADYGCRPLSLENRGGDVMASALADLLRAHRPEVTVFWSPRAQVYGSKAHRAAGAPGRTAWVQHVMPSRFWLHQDASALPTDLVICVSSAVERRQCELYPLHPTRVVHPGVDACEAVPREVARARLGCAAPEFLVGVVGRIEPWKGQDIAVRMLARLAARGLDVQLVLLGERCSPSWPGFGPEVAALARGLGLMERVVFPGHVTDVPAVLPALDVLVCASREEGFGLAAVEAMAARVPVVSTRCGGPEDVIEHERTGLLVPVEDPHLLSDAVEHLLVDRGLAAGLAERAGEVWQERFTARSSAEEFLAAVTNLAGDSRHGNGPAAALPP